jgi:RNA polymerase sigma-70 factor (ECF subfamily)
MSPEEFNAVFRALLPEVSKFLSRRVGPAEVEDLAADLFELAWSKRHQIEKGFELPWLYKSARYLIANHHRKQSGRTRILASLAEPVSAPSAESLALADMELAEAWKLLSTKEQELITLWAFENLSAKEIAKVLSISENASNIRLTRAKQKLILLLSENN